MRGSSLIRLAIAVLCGLSAVGCATGTASDAAHGPAATVATQVADLDRELYRLEHAATSDQPQLMHDYWGMLQRQLIAVRNLPGVEPHDCRDWMLVPPTIVGAQPARALQSCPAPHDVGPISGWELPAAMSPRLFRLTMEQQLGVLRSQAAAIQAETDPHQRVELLRNYYDTRYQDIQTVLGRGWMWQPRALADLPEPQSLGAALLVKYCSQCHAAPPPTLRTPAEWHHITLRMRDIIQSQSRTTVMGISRPSPEELDTIGAYLEAHGGR